MQAELSGEAAKARDPSIRTIVVDPRTTPTAAAADLHLAIEPGSDVALFHGMLHLMLWDERVDRAFIAEHTSGFDSLKEIVREFTPRVAAEICGIAEADLLQAARWFAEGPTLSLYCQGLNQSSAGTAKNAALINLHLATGQIARLGAGPFSLTGQPNAMGGREAGLLSQQLPGYRFVEDPGHRRELENFWGRPEGFIRPQPGLTAVEMFRALEKGQLKAIWIAGTNPMVSIPDLHQVRRALAHPEVQRFREVFGGDVRRVRNLKE